ncbi:DUF3046 domain-containing protein [Bradyrhizobium algeriense]
MRHTEFWARMEAALGESFAHFWAGQHVSADPAISGGPRPG